MTDTVLLRRNHYDVLGLALSATSADIAQAFATELRKPRAFGDLGAISIAYETLRDPIKRRAYDASLGLKKQGEAVKTAGASFLYPAMTAPVMKERSSVRQPATASAPVVPQVTPESATETPSEALLRRLSHQSPLPQPEPEHDLIPLDVPVSRAAPLEPEPDIAPATLAQVEAIRRRVARTEGGAIEWTRPATIAAGLIAFVGLFGAWAGWEAGSDLDEPRAAAKAAAPAAKSSATGDLPVLPQSAGPAVTGGEPAVRLTTPSSAARQAAAPAAVNSEAQEVAQPDGNPDPLSPVDEAANAPQAQGVASNLPLPKRVVASTLGKIGYPCGQVTTSAIIDGGTPGAFKVTCTSGHSYQATPVRGRYRFRRWSGR